ncbi:MBL fold metallo-hydrolase [Paenibacillus mendelii]|uniref:MBL fold metallo-hydrolase n=1 Tax=Paenibacillus mendelii TaxID=206163 RepID=A0ABV6J418_9BACL|nr:MBL fold metallo-hydrolase [Paenibacillus mendelii]MCQ6561852.1 MBL fold metallo-hydrolase [Paenibacillus mendelii]
MTNGKQKFVNQIPTAMDMGIKATMTMLRDFMRGNPNRQPASPIPTKPFYCDDIPDPERTQVTWFGHSAFLLEIEGKRLLFDPMLADTPSPFPLFGGKRYSRSLPIERDKFPFIDAVVMSHDHYDHLDYHSIRALKDRVGRFFVPLGVRNRLVKWGVDPAKVTEHNWWSEIEFNGLTLACTPARHFSGRGIFGRNTTLWCSWVIAGKQAKVYYSGDSGYGPHFQEIGDQYGPFDLTLMECGQYDERWSGVHMMPEQTVQAHLDVKGSLLIPVHWGAFTLAFHEWTDPVERATKAAKARQVRIATPVIGETVVVGSCDYPTADWWKQRM